MVGHKRGKHMNRRSFVKMMGIAGATCDVSDSSYLLASEADRLPNFILITADDLNYDSMGCYGCNIPQITANIDRLAARGSIRMSQPCRKVSVRPVMLTAS